VLYAAGESGRPELLVTRGGKSQRVVADRGLPQDEWTRCRVEIDGRELALWIGGHRAGRQASDFRPCDAFPPDAVKRNFLAAARDGSRHFHGMLDFVRVYYTVHQDFDQVTEPRRHSPRRVSREFIEYVKQQAGSDEQVKRQVDERYKKEYQYYAEMKKQIDARALEIRESTPRAVQARDAIPKTKKKSAGGQQDVGAAEREYAEATAEASQPFWPEIQWLDSISRAAYASYYNTPYSRYLSSMIRAEIGGGEGPVENVGALEAAYASQAPESWKTRCDWQWRTRWELNGSIAELPLLREWLERGRGNVLLAPQK
jgi:hypothetical protein